MTQLLAQPYDVSATGFYFETAEEQPTSAKRVQPNKLPHLSKAASACNNGPQ